MKSDFYECVAQIYQQNRYFHITGNLFSVQLNQTEQLIVSWYVLGLSWPYVSAYKFGFWERTLVFLLYINFSTVDIHYLGYTHTFLKGLPSFTLPINNPLNTWGSAAKIPCSSFMKSSELSLPDFTLDMGLMRIHLPRNGSEGNKIRSCQIECKAKMLGFLGECQGWHLLAYSQQESWSSSQLECRRNNPPPPVSLPGFYSQQRQASCPGGCASKGLGGAPL